MKKSFPIGLLTALFLGTALFAHHASAADPDSGPGFKGDYFTKQLDSYVVGKKPAMYVIERVEDKLDKDPAMLQVSYDWSVRMTEVKDIDQFNAFYYMLRSDLAHKMAKALPKGKDTKADYKKYGLDALQSLLTFEMMVMADAARCKNEFDDKILGELLKPRYEVLGQYVYSFLPPDEMPEVWDDALQAEAGRKTRAPNAEICSNGALIGLRIMQNAGKSKIPEAVTPEYITDDQWQEERDHLRYSIKDFWKDRYENKTQKAIKK